MQLPRLLAGAIERAGGAYMHGEGAMGHADPLGPPGGAGGVDDISELLGMDRQRRRGVRQGGEIQPLQHEGGYGSRQRRPVRLHKGEGGAGIGHHVGDALGRMVGIERYEGRSRLQYPKEGCHRTRPALEAHRHPRLRRDAKAKEMVGDAVGAPLQVGERQGFIPADHGWRIGTAPRRLGDQVGHQIIREGQISRPGRGELVEGRRIHQRDVGDGGVGHGEAARRQSEEKLRHPLYGRRPEQVAGIAEGGDYGAVRLLGGLQHQVEGDGTGVAGHGGQGEAGHAGGALVHQMAVHHLEQRAAGKAALGLERLHHLLEGRVLKRLGIEHGGPRRVEKFAVADGAADLGADHQRVHQQADEVLRLRPVAVGGGDAEPQVALARQAEQQGQQHGHEPHGGAGAGLLHQVAQARGQLR